MKKFTEMDYGIYCLDCSSELRCVQKSNGDLYIEPCDYCLDNMDTNSHSDGYEQGYNDGYDDGYNERGCKSWD